MYDSKTREPVPDAYVYLNGTAIYTSTGSDGSFTLMIDTKINTTLIVAHMGYHSYVVQDPHRANLSDIYLEEDVGFLEAAIVSAENSTVSREQKIRIFRKILLGETRAASFCSITNEDDISFNYDSEARILTAHASRPLVIKNSFLGYMVRVNLDRFEVTFQEYAYGLEYAPNTYKIHYTSMFQDLSPGNERMRRRRDDAYKGSFRHFILSLVNNALKQNNFVLYKGGSTFTGGGGKIERPDDYFTIEKIDDGSYTIMLNEANDLSKRYTNISYPVKGVLNVRYGNIISDIIFVRSQFNIDKYGNMEGNNIILVGNMSQRRIGDILPLEYSQIESKSKKSR